MYLAKGFCTSGAFGGIFKFTRRILLTMASQNIIADCAPDLNQNLLLIALDLLSSSSEDEDFELEKYSILREKTEIWKVKNFINVVRNYSDKQFQANSRLRKTTVYEIITNYAASEFYPSDSAHGGKTPVCAEIDVLCFLWFASNKTTLRVVAQLFGIGLTTAFRQNNRVMAYLINIAATIIKLPEDKEEAAANFSRVSGFPNILGCIDGTSIHIRTPSQKVKSTYVNRHDTPAITLQAICDVNKKFIDVCVGIPGKVHDARVYKLSDISENLPAYCENRYHILGDGAYPLREWLLVPLRDYGNLEMAEITYNRKFCATRVLIENSFALLKGRFRQLLNVDMHKVDKISQFVLCCCVLHNLCIAGDELCDEVGTEPEIGAAILIGAEDDQQSPLELKRLGEVKRQNIMASFL